LKNIHDSSAYLAEVSKQVDTRYSDKVSLETRDKRGTFRWKPDFLFRDDDGSLKELKLKDIISGKYLDLESFPESSLRLAGMSDDEINRLVAEDKGYEILVNIHDSRYLAEIAKAFIKHASTDLVDEDGFIIPESEAGKRRRAWPDAYDTAAIIILGDIDPSKSLASYSPATFYQANCGTSGEFSFVINKNLGLLTASPEHRILTARGFTSRPCLANTAFVELYIDVV